VSVTRCTCGAGHATFGACLRAKNIRIGYAASARGLDRTREKRWDAELAAYADARRQGIQPDGTRLSQVRQALDISDRTGVAYGSGTPG